MRTYSRPSALAMPSAIEVLPTPGGPTNSKSPLGDRLRGRSFIARLAGLGNLGAQLPIGTIVLAALLGLLCQIGRRLLCGALGRELAHGQELEHAILSRLRGQSARLGTTFARSRSILSSLRAFHGSSLIHSR